MRDSRGSWVSLTKGSHLTLYYRLSQTPFLWEAMRHWRQYASDTSHFHLNSLHASYAISVRQASVLPAASFRFHLTMDTLAVQLTIPPVGFVGDFHSLLRAPCRAHNTKAADQGVCRFLSCSDRPSQGESKGRSQS